MRCIGSYGRAEVVDVFEDVVYVGVDFIIGDANDAVAAGEQNSVAFGVSLTLLIMDSAVYLDDETSAVAVEIYDETAQHMLPSDMQPVEGVATETIA